MTIIFDFIIAIVFTGLFFLFCNFLYNRRERKIKERSLEEYLAREERDRILKEKIELCKRQLRRCDPNPSKYEATSLRTSKNSISTASSIDKSSPSSSTDLISHQMITTAIALSSSYDSASSYSSCDSSSSGSSYD